ncbi:WXG100 family type VII secretion target [Paenibacillus sp. W2I17]|uniref:WXG100 family type VII secretion target n=1 Tax=Paenibacillus sp. W2I17 TaxID=3042311 RepID=UPI002781032B|nr:WXG100 family type VII secretion target [Paenibacillus sp. W2I17]MDQ0658467.1 WXG100 family type VII secretion target [Paenibacillus sp. W2I17]
MTQIKVTPEQLETVSGQFAQAHQQLSGFMSTLDGKMSFMRSNWDGMERERFYNDYSTAQGTMKSVLELVLSIQSELKKIAERFRTTDEEAVSQALMTALTAARALSTMSKNKGDDLDKTSGPPKNMDEWDEKDAEKYQNYEEMLKKAKEMGDEELAQQIQASMNIIRLQYEDVIYQTDPNTGKTVKITEDSIVGTYQVKSDKGETTSISLDKQGNVVDYTKDTEKYKYSEQTHTTSQGEHLFGKVAQTATAYGIGLLLTSKTGSAFTEHATGLGSSLVADKFLFSVPEEGETRTMIYRTNKETGKMENMIVVTRGDNEIEYTPWRDYF